MNIDTIYKGKTILLTGHTGFKGSWMATWLQKMGANVIGYALPPMSSPSHIKNLKLDIQSVHGDIRDLEKLQKVVSEHKPDAVFHLAAQSLVRTSYQNPIETYDVNVMGTLKLFEAARSCESIRAIVNVTSDKCYENKEWPWSYRENEPMGGYDPYSSSKGCSEILTASYRNSYFSPDDFNKKHQCLLASGRAGNVIGGGDWAEARLIPDAMRAISSDSTLTIRSPKAIRPWQHVLEPIRGYLHLGAHLLEGKKDFATGWNFGPNESSCVSVGEILEKLKQRWDRMQFTVEDNPYHEANFLKLDSSKAKQLLGLEPKLNIEQTLDLTSQWYKEFYTSNQTITDQQIDWYTNLSSS